jgi:hypothetical protein
MPEYIQIQTYAKCNEDNFTTLLRRYRDVLRQLGCEDRGVLTWLSALSWPTTEDDMFGDICASPFTLSLDNMDDIACAGLHILVFSYSAVPSIEELPAWIGLNLLFDSETLKNDKTDRYHPGVGAILWQIMLELIATFSEMGVYLTDEWQENRTWRVLAEGEGNPWAFDLAIFPRRLSHDFEPTPPEFEGTVLEQTFGFALEKRWETLPWIEAEEMWW